MEFSIFQCKAIASSKERTGSQKEGGGAQMGTNTGPQSQKPELGHLTFRETYDIRHECDYGIHEGCGDLP